MESAPQGTAVSTAVREGPRGGIINDGNIWATRTKGGAGSAPLLPEEGHSIQPGTRAASKAEEGVTRQEEDGTRSRSHSRAPAGADARDQASGFPIALFAVCKQAAFPSRGGQRQQVLQERRARTDPPHISHVNAPSPIPPQLFIMDMVAIVWH